ncbi:zinc finger CCCH domain-containing protein 53-like [Miscanthus floridulus]|uniref:zinc finger CCCH domain-containing protein 53-like n=1 Tax=Miscanthus floridulus TaxID=154761 RepID=UPI0034574E76
MRTLDSENGSKMMGLLLIQDNSDKELIRLAFGLEHLLHALVATARAKLVGKPASPPSPVLGPLQTGPPWELPSPGAGHHQHHQSPFTVDQLGYDGSADAFYIDDYGVWSPAGSAGSHRRSFSLSDAKAPASWRPCMYYTRVYCKNGSSCRFLNGMPEDDATKREMAVMRAKALAAAPPPP